MSKHIKYPRTVRQRQIDVGDLTDDEDVSIQKTGNLVPKSEDKSKYHYQKLKRSAREKYPTPTKENIDNRYSYISKKTSISGLPSSVKKIETPAKKTFIRDEWSYETDNKIGPYTLHKTYKDKKGFNFTKAKKGVYGMYNPWNKEITGFGQRGKRSSVIAHEIGHKEEGKNKGFVTKVWDAVKFKFGSSDYYKDKHHNKPAFDMDYYKSLGKNNEQNKVPIKKGKKGLRPKSF